MARFYSDDFWGRVRQRMTDLGLTMTDLSRLSGLPYGSIYRQINAGIVPTKPEHVSSIASVLGTTVDYLLTGANKEQNTLPQDLMDMVLRYKVLRRDQKDVVDALIRQFTEDNKSYAELFVQAHPNQD